MTIIENGSIEIIRGVGQNSVSEGKVFEPADQFDADDPAGSIERITGADIGAPRQVDYPASVCLGSWSGVDQNGKQATIIVWIAPD